MSIRTRFLRQLGVYGYDFIEPVILAALVSEDPLLLIGRHGTGKTFLLNSLSEALGLEHRHYNASLVAFDDLVGFPFPDKEGTSIRYIQTPATVWGAESVLVDELNRCKPEHQNRFFSLVHERKIQGMPLTGLRYRWAAMNPSGESDGYIGAEPLDPALADRFAFIVKVADWDALTPEEKTAVTDPRGDGAISRDGGKLREFLKARRARFEQSLREPPRHLLDYARLVSTTLGDAGVRLSPRRARQLARNLLAVCAVSELPLERLFKLALRSSIPQEAGAESVPAETIAAAHRAAWDSVALTGRDKWLHDFACEPDLSKKTAMLFEFCPDSDTGSIAIAQLIAAERPERAGAFGLAVFPYLLECEAGPVGVDGVNDLGGIALAVAQVEGEVTWRDAKRTPYFPSAGKKWEANIPGYDAAVLAMASSPKPRQARARQYLDWLVAQSKDVPESWPELLEQFEQCIKVVSRFRRATVNRRGPTAA